MMAQLTENKTPKEHATDHYSGARLLDYHTAAHYLSLSYWTIRDMASRGEIPCVRAGRRVLIDREDLDDWISRNKEQWS